MRPERTQKFLCRFARRECGNRKTWQRKEIAIAESSDRSAGAEEVAEFALMVQRDGIPNDVIMNVRLVGMGADDEGIPALQKAAGQLVADPVSLLRRDLSRLEGLPDLVGDHVAFLLSSGKDTVLPLRQQELALHGLHIALIRGNQLALLRLARIHRVGRPVMQALRQRLAFVLVHRDNSCCCEKVTSVFIMNNQNEHGILMLRRSLILTSFWRSALLFR